VPRWLARQRGGGDSREDARPPSSPAKKTYDRLAVAIESLSGSREAAIIVFADLIAMVAVAWPISLVLSRLDKRLAGGEM
jgi:hypothetical protein